MKIKYRINDTVNGIRIGTRFKYKKKIWERNRLGWRRTDKEYDLTNPEEVATIDENFKNGNYETV